MSQNKDNNLTNIQYWEQRPQNNLGPAAGPYSFQPLLERFIPPNPAGTALEIGACPGHHLAALSLKLGYQPVALDFVPQVQGLPPEFARLGIPGLRAIQEDFFKWNPGEHFDVVTSYGFIEHFQSWDTVISQHWKLVKTQGWLVIGVPVLGPLQMMLRKLVYTPAKLESVLQSHNLEAMSLRNLVSVFRNLPDVQILFASHIWQMYTWIQPNDPGLKSSASLVLKLWRGMAAVPKTLGWSCRFFSPYAVVIARKTSQSRPCPQRIR